jgi:DNA-binding transcriptional LysR family regulator
LGPFRTQYAGIELELHICKRNVNFTVEGDDFAIRLGKITEKGLMARKLGSFALGV